MLHAGGEHGGARFAVGKSHSDGHQGAGTVWLKRRFHMVVGRWVGQVHALDMNDSAVRLQGYVLSCDMEGATFPVGPLIAHLAAGLRVVDAHGHGPTVGTEQPLLDERRFCVCTVHRFWRSGEVPCHDDMGIAFGGKS